MAENEAKVNMSLDDIIKMEKKKKSNAQKNQKRGGGGGGRARGGGARGRGNQRNQRGRGNQNNQVRGRSRSQTRQNNNNKRGSYNRRFNNVRNGQGGGGFKNYNNFNNNKPKTNLQRSRSNVSLNRMNGNANVRRGSFGGTRRGGKFGGLTRSRSRNNLSYNKPFLNKNKGGIDGGYNSGFGGGFGGGGFLKRTSSMPNLSDPNSVHNRLGYQNPSTVAYRNRVKRAKNVLLQKNNKALKMQNALMLSPTKNMPPLNRRMPARRYSAGALRSDQMARAQKRAQYEQKLIRMSTARPAAPMSYDYDNYFDNYNPISIRHPAMALYNGPVENHNSVGLRQLPRGRSHFRRNLQSVKSIMMRQFK